MVRISGSSSTTSILYWPIFTPCHTENSLYFVFYITFYIGREKINLLPAFSLLSTRIFPPWASTSPLQIATLGDHFVPKRGQRHQWNKHKSYYQEYSKFFKIQFSYLLKWIKILKVHSIYFKGIWHILYHLLKNKFCCDKFFLQFPVLMNSKERVV